MKAKSITNVNGIVNQGGNHHNLISEHRLRKFLKVKICLDNAANRITNLGPMIELSPSMVVFDGNLSAESVDAILSLCHGSGKPTFFEPTDLTKAAKGPFSYYVRKNFNVVWSLLLGTVRQVLNFGPLPPISLI